jgi:hypothetical protein
MLSRVVETVRIGPVADDRSEVHRQVSLKQRLQIAASPREQNYGVNHEKASDKGAGEHKQNS